METVVDRKLYEGMFLVDSARAVDWDDTIAEIEGILNRVGAEIVSIRKWDERKLAYEIAGRTRGTYILSYFRVGGDRVQEIEKAVQLSESIMRVLILNAEQIPPEQIEKDTPATKAEKEQAARQAKADEKVPAEEPAEAPAQAVAAQAGQQEKAEAEEAGQSEEGSAQSADSDEQEISTDTEAGQPET